MLAWSPLRDLSGESDKSNNKNSHQFAHFGSCENCRNNGPVPYLRSLSGVLPPMVYECCCIAPGTKQPVTFIQ